MSCKSLSSKKQSWHRAAFFLPTLPVHMRTYPYTSHHLPLMNKGQAAAGYHRSSLSPPTLFLSLHVSCRRGCGPCARSGLGRRGPEESCLSSSHCSACSGLGCCMGGPTTLVRLSCVIYSSVCLLLHSCMVILSSFSVSTYLLYLILFHYFPYPLPRTTCESAEHPVWVADIDMESDHLAPVAVFTGRAGNEWKWKNKRGDRH